MLKNITGSLLLDQATMVASLSGYLSLVCFWYQDKNLKQRYHTLLFAASMVSAVISNKAVVRNLENI